MQGLFVDIDNDLSEIVDEVVLFSQLRDHFITNRAAMPDFALWGGVVAIASGVEKVYTPDANVS